jgi:hypothetical protein
MQKVIPTVWISSIDHLNSFSLLAKKNPWWKLLLALNKVPNDFPQMKVGVRKYPLVLYSAGTLTLFERELEFRASNTNSANNQIFLNLKDDLYFEIPYSSLTVTRYTYPKPFLKAFNIPWINLSLSGNNSVDPVLLSFGGNKLNMNQVTKANNEIFEILKNKTAFPT